MKQETVRVNVSVNSEDETDLIAVHVPKNQLEIWDKEAEEMDMSRSTAVRVWSAVGRRFIKEYEPDKQTEADHIDALEEVLKNHVPIGEENAQTVDEIIDSVAEDAESEAWDLFIEDDSIARKKGKFYEQ